MKNEAGQEDRQAFHELLIVTYSSDKKKYEDLKNKYKLIVCLLD
jgi:hypothetical protein